MIDLATALEEAATGHLEAAIQVVGEAFAAAVAREAPRRTGALATTAHYANGALVIKWYGLLVNSGHRGAPRRGRTITRSAQPARYTPANPFLDRAWASPEVQDALATMPDILFSVSY